MERVISIISLYNPNDNQINNIEIISKQSNIVFLCDNSAVSNEKKYLHIQNVIYIHFGINKGLSNAFNSVLRNRDFEWNDEDFILFFDQDTIIPCTHINKMIVEYNKLISKKIKVGCVGPRYNDVNSSKNSHILNLNEIKEVKEVNQMITSSMCIKYKTLKDIEWWNEKIFLDMADWDLCWRLREQGYKCYISNVSTIAHEIGRGEKKIGPFKLKVGEPIREYYQTRDCSKLILAKYVPFKYRVRFVLMLTIRPVLHILFLDQKKKRLKYIFQGIIDRINHRDGSLTNNSIL